MMSAPLRIILVGTGVMGRQWARTITASSKAELVGLVDLDLPLARKVAAEEGLHGITVGTSVDAIAAECDAQAVVNATVPMAHRPVNEAAMRLGLPVLCEKPISGSLSGALQQAALAEVTGSLLMVSQSRRYYNSLRSLREVVAKLGRIGTVVTDFFHEDHEPGFREQMAHPLLVDMSVHHFDALRYVTNLEPIAVRCNAWNPPWSWFAGSASAAAEFELESGARYVYSGSRATPGFPTSWNGLWRIHAEHGAAVWDGDGQPMTDPTVEASVFEEDEEIAGSLTEFCRSVRDRVTPQNEIHANIMSLAMIEAAVVSSTRSGERVVIGELLEESWEQAVATEDCDDVEQRLAAWGSGRMGVDNPAWPMICAESK